MADSILHVGGGRGGRGGRGWQQGQPAREPEVFSSARMKINLAQGDVNKIKDILKELWVKVTCPAGKTKPTLNLNLPTDGKLASANANVQIQELKNACGYQNSGTTPGSSSFSEVRAPDVKIADINTLSMRIITSFTNIGSRLDKLKVAITDASIGNKKLKEVVKEYTGEEQRVERDRNFTTRLFDLQTKQANLLAEVNQIVDFARKGAPSEAGLYLNEYYRSLLAVQSALAGAISTSERSGAFPTSKESSSRLTQQTADLITKLTTLELDVNMAANTPSSSSEEEEPTDKDPFLVNFITNTDLRDETKLNEYLTSTKPYYYFDMETLPKFKVGDSVIYETNIVTITKVTGRTKDTEPTYGISTKPGESIEEANLELEDPTLLVDGFSSNETYRNIKAVNAYGCLQIIENYESIIKAFSVLPDDKFVFINDVCKYLFKLPDGKETFSYAEAIKKKDFKKQLPILATIHHIHFIGTLIKTSGKEASVGDIGDYTAKSKDKTTQLEAADKSIRDARENLKKIMDTLLDIEDRLKIAADAVKGQSPKPPTDEEKAVEAVITEAETKLNERIAEKDILQTRLREEKQKLEKLESELDLSNAATRRDKLAKIGTLKTHIQNINNEIAAEDETIKRYTKRLNDILEFYIIPYNENEFKDMMPFLVANKLVVSTRYSLRNAEKAVNAAEAEVAKLNNPTNQTVLTTAKAVEQTAETTHTTAVEALEQIRKDAIGTAKTNMDNFYKLQETSSIPIVDIEHKPVILALFKRYDIIQKEKAAKEKEIADAKAEVAETEAKHKKLSAEHEGIGSSIKGVKDKYAVPDFRGNLVAKYKYTQNFKLNTDINITLDDIVKNIYRSTYNNEFQLQTFEKIQTMMKSPSILPPLGVTEEKATTMPGTVKSISKKDLGSEMAEVQRMIEKEKADTRNQKLNVIIQLGIDFIEAYRPSIKAEFIAKRPAAKKSAPFTFQEIDLMVEAAKVSLPTSPTAAMPKYVWDTAQQKYTQLKGLMYEYERLV